MPTPEQIKKALEYLPQKEESLVASVWVPNVKSAAVLVADKTICMPEQVIHDVLHKGSKALLAGSSKERKTWISMHLAISVANGLEWWGWPTTRGRVLYVNYELLEAVCKQRFEMLAQQLREANLDHVDVISIRADRDGRSRSFEEQVSALTALAKSKGYSLIILDPLYKALGHLEENSARDIASLCQDIENLAADSGAAVLSIAHFSKGIQSRKESIDRISGSGVYARDADTIITLTKHQEEHASVVELTLRNHRFQPPFVVQWQQPLMVRMPSLNPSALQQAGSGRPTKVDKMQVLDVLGSQALRTAEWLSQVKSKLGISESTFERKKKELLEGGFVTVGGDSQWRRRERIPPPK